MGGEDETVNFFGDGNVEPLPLPYFWLYHTALSHKSTLDERIDILM